MRSAHCTVQRRTPIARRAVVLGLLLSGLPAHASAAADADDAWQTVVPTQGHGPSARHESGLAAVDGRLWLLGGRGQRPVEAWSAGSNRWRVAAPMPARLHHFQPAVVGQAIYAFGAFVGDYPDETPVKEIHRFDTATESWSVAGDVPADRRRGGAATAVLGDWIYLVGGNTLGHNGGAVPWLDRYRPSDGAWEVLADAPHARDHFSAGFAGGLLVAAGGRATDLPNPFDNMIAATDVYDPATDSWAIRADIPTRRAGTLAVATCDELIVAGGEDTGRAAQARVEAYDVVQDSWRVLQPLDVGRHSGGGALLRQHFHVVAGSSVQGGGGEVSTHEFLSVTIDSDCDGLSDEAERNLHGSDPLRPDTDDDGLPDALEVELGTDPSNPDSDEDGLSDGRERELGTDPLDGDSDSDTLGDGAEVAAGTDPLVAQATPPVPEPVDPEPETPGPGQPEPEPEPEQPERPDPVQPDPVQPGTSRSGGGGASVPLFALLIGSWWQRRRRHVHHCPQSAG